jgi:hypothetical protein
VLIAARPPEADSIIKDSINGGENIKQRSQEPAGEAIRGEFEVKLAV